MRGSSTGWDNMIKLLMYRRKHYILDCFPLPSSPAHSDCIHRFLITPRTYCSAYLTSGIQCLKVTGDYFCMCAQRMNLRKYPRLYVHVRTCIGYARLQGIISFVEGSYQPTLCTILLPQRCNVCGQVRRSRQQAVRGWGKLHSYLYQPHNFLQRANTYKVLTHSKNLQYMQYVVRLQRDDCQVVSAIKHKIQGLTHRQWCILPIPGSLHKLHWQLSDED